MTKIKSTITMEEGNGPEEPGASEDSLNPFQPLDPFSDLSPVLQMFYQILSSNPSPQTIQKLKHILNNNLKTLSPR